MGVDVYKDVEDITSHHLEELLRIHHISNPWDVNIQSTTDTAEKVDGLGRLLERGPCHVVSGQAGSGKTVAALTAAISMLRRRRQPHDPLAVYMPLSAALDELERRKQIALRAAKEGIRVLCLLDGLDEVSGNGRASVRGLLRELIRQQGIVVVITCSDAHYLKLDLQGVDHEVWQVLPLSRRFINNKLNKLRGRLGSHHALTGRLSDILGVPMYLQIALSMDVDEEVTVLSVAREAFSAAFHRACERYNESPDSYKDEAKLTCTKLASRILNGEAVQAAELAQLVPGPVLRKILRTGIFVEREETLHFRHDLLLHYFGVLHLQMLSVAEFRNVLRDLLRSPTWHTSVALYLSELSQPVLRSEVVDEIRSWDDPAKVIDLVETLVRLDARWSTTKELIEYICSPTFMLSLSAGTSTNLQNLLRLSGTPLWQHAPDLLERRVDIMIRTRGIYADFDDADLPGLVEFLRKNRPEVIPELLAGELGARLVQYTESRGDISLLSRFKPKRSGGTKNGATGDDAALPTETTAEVAASALDTQPMTRLEGIVPVLASRVNADRFVTAFVGKPLQSLVRVWSHHRIHELDGDLSARVMEAISRLPTDELAAMLKRSRFPYLAQWLGYARRAGQMPRLQGRLVELADGALVEAFLNYPQGAFVPPRRASSSDRELELSWRYIQQAMGEGWSAFTTGLEEALRAAIEGTPGPRKENFYHLPTDPDEMTALLQACLLWSSDDGLIAHLIGHAAEQSATVASRVIQRYAERIDPDHPELRDRFLPLVPWEKVISKVIRAGNDVTAFYFSYNALTLFEDQPYAQMLHARLRDEFGGKTVYRPLAGLMRALGIPASAEPYSYGTENWLTDLFAQWWEAGCVHDPSNLTSWWRNRIHAYA